MATYSKILLSGSTNGKGIKVAGTAIGSATTIHTAASGTGFIDLLDLWAVNSDTVPHKLTLAWGGTTNPDNAIEIFLAPESGLVPVAIKLPIQNSLVVGAFTDVTNMVVIYGTASHIA